MVRRAVRRAIADGSFRAAVLQNVREVEARYPLAREEERVLVQEVMALEWRYRLDPFQDTEVDHGEQDAAGEKG